MIFIDFHGFIDSFMRLVAVQELCGGLQWFAVCAPI